MEIEMWINTETEMIEAAYPPGRGRPEGRTMPDRARFEMICDASSLIVTATKQVFGSIHCRLGKVHFPADDWTDFAALVVSEWLIDISKLRDDGAAVRLPFFDGPYAVSGVRVQGQSVRLTGLRNDRATGASCTVELPDIQRNLVHVARCIAAACKQRNIDSPDVVSLVAQISLMGS